MNTITPGNYVRPFVKGLNDPMWDISNASQHQPAILTEDVSSRLMSVVGFLNFDRAASTYVELEDFVDGLNAPPGVYQGQSVDFMFSGFDLQKCYSLQLESALIQTTIPYAVERSLPADGELCGDFVNDNLARRVRFLNFGIESRRAGDAGCTTGSIRIKEKGGSRQRVIQLRLFDQTDNGHYSFEEFFTLFAARLKEKVEAHYQNIETFPVEFFVNPQGRLVLAWKIGPLIKAAGGGFYWFQIDLNTQTSPIWSFIKYWMKPIKMRRGDITEGTVSAGDGMEFLIVERAAEVSEAFNRSTGPVILTCSELTRYQKFDSVTPLSTTGEIAVGVFSAANQLAFGYGTDNETNMACSIGNNSLSSGKINFDPTATVNNFTVKLTSGNSNPLLTNILLQLIEIDGKGGVTEDVLNGVSLTLNFRIY